MSLPLWGILWHGISRRKVRAADLCAVIVQKPHASVHQRCLVFLHQVQFMVSTAEHCGGNNTAWPPGKAIGVRCPHHRQLNSPPAISPLILFGRSAGRKGFSSGPSGARFEPSGGCRRQLQRRRSGVIGAMPLKGWIRPASAC